MTSSDASHEYPARWHPPLYHFSSTSIPSLLSRTAPDYDDDHDVSDNFPRTAKWCGDGSSLMVQCENRSFQVFSACHEKNASPDNVSSPSLGLVHSNTFTQPAPIVDFAWYPGASRHHLPGFCFVASVRDCPVKLLDGTDGRLRASYPIVDHRERHVAPHSLAFNVTANKLYCGFEDAIEVFDVHRPGEGDRLPTTPSKKSKDGLKGIVSALAFSYSPEYYAAGSLTPASQSFDNIALFNESVLEPVLSVGGVAALEKGGVTQLMFNYTRPHVLYAAFRRSDTLWSWDLRGDASVPVCSFSRSPAPNASESGRHLTNQKLRFDIDAAGRWLAFGSQAGKISVYDLGTEDDEPSSSTTWGQTRTSETMPALSFDAHDDAVGAVGFHPLDPVLFSLSGSRHFDHDDDDDDLGLTTGGTEDRSESDSDSDSSDESTGDEAVGGGVVRRTRERPRPFVRDASIKMWQFRDPET